jgi:hypothetical protein
MLHPEKVRKKELGLYRVPKANEMVRTGENKERRKLKADKKVQPRSRPWKFHSKEPRTMGGNVAPPSSTGLHHV